MFAPAPGAGLDDPGAGPIDRDRDHPPDAPTHGLTSWDLADWQHQFGLYAQTRILGIGAHQYDEAGSQKFEHLPLADLYDELLDELADVVNYAAMLAARISRARQQSEGIVT